MGMHVLLIPIGSLVFAGALFTAGVSSSMFGTSDLVQQLETQSTSTQDAIQQAETVHQDLKQKRDNLVLEEKEKAHVLSLAEADHTNGKENYAQQVAQNQAAMLVVLKEVGTLRDSIKNSETEIDAIRKKQESQQNLSQWLLTHQNYMITLYINDVELRSGFMVSNNRNRILLLTDGLNMPAPDLSFKGSFLVAQRRDPVLLNLCVNRNNRDGSISSLAVVESSLNARGLTVDNRPQPKIGDIIYTVCNIQLGNQAVEYNIFDGTVSADAVKINETMMYQTTLPPNKGSSGALVLDDKGALCGMLVIRSYRNRLSTFLIPNSEILKSFNSF